MYRRTQIGWASLTIVGAVGAFVLLAARAAAPPAVAPIIAVLAGSALMCGTLTIAVDDEGVAWWLTGGIARRRVRFDEIRSMRTRRIFPLGFGIRTNLAGGWSWIVTGTRAIEIETEDRRTFIVGCDDPDAVVAAIRRHVIIA